MTKAKLSDFRDIDDFARAVGEDPGRILEYAGHAHQKTYYYQISIPKRGRKRRKQYRHVFKAKATWLSALHRSVAMIVGNSVEFDNHVQGFIKGRSIRTNAELHLAAGVLLHADIKNFFDCITTEQVKFALITAGLEVALSDVLARACTIDGYLRQGTRCSPALANLVCQGLDHDMLGLGLAKNATYTRYADDITFSGDQVPAVSAVQTIVQKHGFRIREGSCFRQYRGRTQFVTGLNVSDDQYPRLHRRLKRRLRLIAYYIDRFGEEAHFARDDPSFITNPTQLYGMLQFVQSIEPKFAQNLNI